MRWMDGINQCNGHELEQTPRDSKGWESGMLQSMRAQRVGHSLGTQQQQRQLENTVILWEQDPR